MSYWHTRSTAEAKAYIDQREAEERIARRPTAAGSRMMGCGLTCQQWIDIYLRRVPLPRNQESEHEQDRRQIAGPQARPIGVGEGVGDAAQEQGEEEARSQGDSEADAATAIRAEGADWIEQAIGPSEEAGSRSDRSWADEAYPEAPVEAGADFSSADRTPF